MSSSSHRPLKFEVWDRDNRFNDDLLGKGDFIPTQGNNVRKQFKLKHGTLFISYTANCGPSLTGPYCGKYAPTPGGDGALNYYQPFGREQPIMFKKSNGFARKMSVL